MFRYITALVVFTLCVLLSKDASAQYSNPFTEEHVWVPGLQLHMAYDPKAELFMAAPGVHFYGVGHSSNIAIGGSLAYFANQKYSMGVAETLIGYDVSPNTWDVHFLFSSGLGVYGYGNAEREVVSMSFPLRAHVSFYDRVVVYLGSRVYGEFWNHPFPFDFGIAAGF